MSENQGTKTKRRDDTGLTLIAGNVLLVIGVLLSFGVGIPGVALAVAGLALIVQGYGDRIVNSRRS